MALLRVKRACSVLVLAVISARRYGGFHSTHFPIQSSNLRLRLHFLRLPSVACGSAARRPPTFTPAMLSSNNPRTADRGSSTGRKRNRAVLSCLSCHQRRVKCDRSQPCRACISRGWGDSCTFDSSQEREERRARSGESSSGRCDAGEKRQAQQPSLPPSDLLPVPNPTSFAVFVDRFLHRSTQADRLDAQQTTPAAATAYPPGSIASIKTALLDLPEAEGAELMVLFFMEQLERL